MSENSPLDTLKTSTDSGLDEANKAAQLDAFTTATGKMVGGKGSKFALPTFSGDSPIDQTVLENLDRMRAEKQAGQGSLANTLLDTLAIFPGDPTLRSQSIGARLAQRNQDEADIANLATTVASGKTAAEQTAIQKQNLMNFLKNEGVGGGGGAGGAGGYGGNTSGLSKDVLARVAQLVGENKIDSANKLLNTHLTDVGKVNRTAFLNKDTHTADIQVSAPTAEDPNATKYISVDDIASGRYKREDITAQGMKTLQGKQETGSGVNQFNVGNIRPEGSSTGFKQPTSYEEGIKDLDNNLKAYGEKHKINTLRGVISRWAPPTENDTESYIKFVSSKLGISPDQQIDLSNPAQRHLISAAIMMQEKGTKNLFTAAPATIAAAPAAAAPAAAPAATLTTAPATTVQPPPKITIPAPGAVGAPTVGLTPGQKVAPELAKEGAIKSDAEFRENTLKPLAERVNTQRNDKLYADMAIDALNKGSYGPGSSIGQMTAQAAQALGLPLSAAEREEYFNKMTIEQVKQNFVASSARAAMGAQFTQVESERFAKTLAGINDPKEYIKTVYQIKKALAEIDEAHVKYIRSHQTNLAQAEDKWSQTGEAERIMRSTVDKFKNLPTGGKSEESKPETSGNKPVRKSLKDMP